MSDKTLPTTGSSLFRPNSPFQHVRKEGSNFEIVADADNNIIAVIHHGSTTHDDRSVDEFTITVEVTTTTGLLSQTHVEHYEEINYDDCINFLVGKFGVVS